MLKEATAIKIVTEIIDDLCDRSGLQNEWDGIDEDIQSEIRETWIKIIMDNGDRQ
jgi:hypothetical protein